MWSKTKLLKSQTIRAHSEPPLRDYLPSCYIFRRQRRNVPIFRYIFPIRTEEIREKGGYKMEAILGKNSHLTRFDFAEEAMDVFMEANCIPVNFYNKNGQILIHKKINASPEDIFRLKKFEEQGIYYLSADRGKFLVQEEPAPEADVQPKPAQTMDPFHMQRLATEAASLLKELKNTSLNGGHINKVNKEIDHILTDFTQCSDVTYGLGSMMNVFKNCKVDVDSEILTKRTVLAMALKLKGMKMLTKKDSEENRLKPFNLMLASYLTDIGKAKMRIPNSPKLTDEEQKYMRFLPIVSYLMIANLPNIDSSVKSTVLNAKRTFRGDGPSNNYPNVDTIVKILSEKMDLCKKDPERIIQFEDMRNQLKALQSLSYSTEDASIISIAGEFASLTSPQNWRDAYDELDAIRFILNQSFFSYNDRTIRDFMNLMAHSLSMNVFRKGDYVVVTSIDTDKKFHFELCMVQAMMTNQSRPLLKRIGSLRPIITNNGKLKISGFDLNSFVLDNRMAEFNLSEVMDPRRIVYVIDRKLDPGLYSKIEKICIARFSKSVA
ncbi:hypothetical protein LEP1GSC047_3965 [Leptospira inadai serovar Lyme str. 10]|uniref:Uncharacterized protein n=2 Tax=Leptospira inadai serovar Lyme TaxID=293084 RepID=V6HWF5_9LEPT|nr:hypothetical protein LEP1GSC047_3965 [Leptospira inadai serovar Lyme str. 10]